MSCVLIVHAANSFGTLGICAGGGGGDLRSQQANQAHRYC